MLSPVTSGNSIHGPRIGKLTSQLGGSSCHSLITVRGRLTYHRLFGEILPRRKLGCWKTTRKRNLYGWFPTFKIWKKRDENMVGCSTCRLFLIKLRRFLRRKRESDKVIRSRIFLFVKIGQTIRRKIAELWLPGFFIRMARYRSARKFFGIKSECLETAGSKFGELISLANSSTRAKNSWLISLQYVRRIFRSLPRRFVSSSSQLPPKEQTYRAIVIEYLFTRRASCSFHGGTKKTREKQLYRRAHFLIVFTREEPIERTGQKGESPSLSPCF